MGRIEVEEVEEIVGLITVMGDSNILQYIPHRTPCLCLLIWYNFSVAQIIRLNHNGWNE